MSFPRLFFGDFIVISFFNIIGLLSHYSLNQIFNVDVLMRTIVPYWLAMACVFFLKKFFDRSSVFLIKKFFFNTLQYWIVIFLVAQFFRFFIIDSWSDPVFYGITFLIGFICISVWRLTFFLLLFNYKSNMLLILNSK